MPGLAQQSAVAAPNEEPAGRLRRFATRLFDSVRPRAPSPVGPEWFTDEEVAGLSHGGSTPENAQVDDATWRDLQVRSLLRALGKSASILALQSLHHRLRAGASSASERSRLQAMDLEMARRELTAVAPIRRQLRLIDGDVTPALFRGQFVALPAWARHVRLIPLAELAVLAVLASLGAWAWLVTMAVASLCVHASIQITLQPALTHGRKLRQTLWTVVTAGLALQEVNRNRPTPASAAPATLSPATLRRLRRLVSPTWWERTPGVHDYAELLALHSCAKLAGDMAVLRAHLAGFQEAYRFVAECEMNACLVEHLSALDTYCWAEQADAADLDLHDAVNPLLAGAQPLSITLHERGAFITGQNGVGKSTLLRTIGLNVIVARAFGFSYASAARVPFVTVWSSIQNEDSLEHARSLYMAELARAERLLQVARAGEPALFILDEMFRATNHVEAVAAAAAVTDYLASRSLVLASSHNAVLGPLLQHRLVPFQVARSEASGALALLPGNLAQTNGIDMMQVYDMPDEVLSTARTVAAWYAAYVAAPDHVPGVSRS